MSRKGQVRLLENVGRGSTATVWKAHHAGLGQTVAVKRVTADRLAERPDEAARLAREAWIGARLQSPHAVRCFAHARRRHAVYLVMEWLEGETLEARLRRGEPLSRADVEAMVRQVAAVLAEAHGLGIVHRDIKPSNLLLVAGHGRPFVKVLDFGIAGMRSDPVASEPRRVLGSPLYMGPERFAGLAELDPRADLWSLAVVAYRALTGVHPFLGRTLADVAEAVQRGEVVPPSRLRPTLPAAVDLWFARAFARDVACRFQTPASFASSFARALSSDDEPTAIAIDIEWAGGEPADEELERTHRASTVGGGRPESGVSAPPHPPGGGTAARGAVADLATVA